MVDHRPAGATTFSVNTNFMGLREQNFKPLQPRRAAAFRRRPSRSPDLTPKTAQFPNSAACPRATDILTRRSNCALKETDASDLHHLQSKERHLARLSHLRCERGFGHPVVVGNAARRDEFFCDKTKFCINKDLAL
ncbi:hypothetical protein BV898_19030 [Hypsibius exemplaris]|uniref:Uncharacterized protein n=1 Tax=Hypsibius exemplaris TaxID=2072580 RepID=A0A9X6NKX9_HYPEX|nr:hypothetical protein BV898_19030 [Hypsibius exemplaris]